MNRKHLILFLFLSVFRMIGQNENDSIDPLNIYDKKQLLNKFSNFLNNDFEKASLYAKALLKNAKNSQDSYDLVQAYEINAHISEKDLPLQIKFLDSALFYSHQIKKHYYPTILYVNKGVAYADAGFFSEALQNYLEGLKSAKSKNDDVYEHIIYHNIALLKRKLGKYEESKKLFLKCLNYEKSKLKNSEKRLRSYLETLSELVITYRRNKEIDSALILNQLGLKESKNLPIRNLFILNKGILNYYNFSYKEAILNLNNGLRGLRKPESSFYSENYNLLDGFLYLGNAHLKIGNREEAIINYKRVDSLISSTNYLIPEIRATYMEIINHYKRDGKIEEQLYYITRLIRYDSILDNNMVDLNIKLNKDYDTPNLIEEKERLINSLSEQQKKSNIFLKILLAITLMSSILFFINYKKKKIYKKRFEQLINTNLQKLDSEVILNEINETSRSDLDISEDVIGKILDGLKVFEKEEGFTKINLTSTLLAKKLNTNTKYLTKIIKSSRSKNFTQYINDLRIEYILNKLKTDKKLLNYTIKALANEAGFNSSEVFSKYFHKKTGIYPSYFIKEMQKIE